MEKVIVVKESTVRPGAKGEYLLVVDHEDIKFSCFQEHKALWAYLDKNMSAKIEYEEVGRYKNIIEAVPMEGQIQVDETVITKQQVRPAPSPQPAPATKADPKNRAFALSYAKDIGCAKMQMGGSITPTEILSIAVLFTSYLDEGYSQEAIRVYAQTQKELKKEE